jgi:hypothetical protein
MVPWSNLSFAANVGLVLLLVSNTCHSKKGFWGTTNTFDVWVGWLVGWSVMKRRTQLRYIFQNSLILCFLFCFLEVLWPNHQLMLTFCEMIHHKLVSAQKHLNLMLESHYLDLVDPT